MELQPVIQANSPVVGSPPPPPPSPAGVTVAKFSGNHDNDDDDDDTTPAGVYSGPTPNMTSTPTKRMRDEDSNHSIPTGVFSVSSYVTPANQEMLVTSAVGTPSKRPRRTGAPCAGGISTGVIVSTPVKHNRQDIDGPSLDKLNSPIKRPRAAANSTTTTTTTTTTATTAAAATAAPVDGLGGASAGRCSDHTGVDSAADCGFVCFERTGLCISPLPPHMWEISNSSELIMGTSAASLDDSNFAFPPAPPPEHCLEECLEQDTVECGVCNTVLERATYNMP